MPYFIVYRPQFTPHKKTITPDVTLTEYSVRLEKVAQAQFRSAEAAFAAHRSLVNPSPILEEIPNA